LNANWVRSSGREAQVQSHSLRARLAMRAIWSARFAGGPLLGEGQLVVPGMAGDHVAAVCCAADAVYRLGGESGRG
jgi:hypothetical protein